MLDSVKDYAIFLLTPEGHVATWNAGAQIIKGYAAHEIVGKHFSVFYPPAALEINWPAQELVFAAERGTFEDEVWRVRRDGTLFWANVVISTIRDEGGALVGFVKVTRDLTDRRTQEQALRESEHGMRLLIEGTRGHAMFLLGADGRVRSWNTGAERLLRYSDRKPKDWTTPGSFCRRTLPRDFLQPRSRGHAPAGTRRPNLVQAVGREQYLVRTVFRL
jgi:PAS domain S-box-containing protein